MTEWYTLFTFWQAFRICHHCPPLFQMRTTIDLHFTPFYTVLILSMCFFQLSNWILNELWTIFEPVEWHNLCLDTIICCGKTQNRTHQPSLLKKKSIRGSQRSRGCIPLMGMYGQSQGLSLLICLFRDMHFGDAPWRALLVRILCMSVCVIDAGNHAKKKNTLRMFKWKIFQFQKSSHFWCF